MLGWGYFCSDYTISFACTLPSLCLVSVIFGTAIPTSFYIFKITFITWVSDMKVREERVNATLGVNPQCFFGVLESGMALVDSCVRLVP